MIAFLRTIILLGAIQGFITSSLFFYSRKNRRSNRLLSALIFLISFASFNLYASYANWFDSPRLSFISNFVPLFILMPVGPLIFFYVKSLLDPGFVITKKQRLHFLPVIVDLVPALTAFVYILGTMLKIFKHGPQSWGNFIDNYNVYSDIPRWISVTSYLWLTARFLSRFKAKNNLAAGIQTANFQWLQQFVRIFLAFQVIWLAYLIPYLIPQFTDRMLDKFGWYPIYIPFSIMIYWLGIKGYGVSREDSVSGKKTTSTMNAAISPSTVQRTASLLEKAMDENRLYLNSDLNLNMLARHTGTPPKTISAVLNHHLHKSFNEFVNGYRVREFKEKISQPAMDNLTIAGVASECGFSSLATFQRTFKQFTGKSPSEFRNTGLEIHQ